MNKVRFIKLTQLYCQCEIFFIRLKNIEEDQKYTDKNFSPILQRSYNKIKEMYNNTFLNEKSFTILEIASNASPDDNTHDFHKKVVKDVKTMIQDEFQNVSKKGQDLDSLDFTKDFANLLFKVIIDPSGE